MTENWLSRTEIIYGGEALTRLAASRVAVFGLGGVGGHAAEALARSGVGAIDIIDKDSVEVSNINRQLTAAVSSLGKRKTEVMEARILDINPSCRVRRRDIFYLPATSSEVDLSEYDYIIDAVDTVTAKLYLAENALKAGVPLISCMGTGNRKDPSKLKVTDISKTKDDPLAKDMRKELRRRGIDRLKVVFSEELPIRKGKTPGSTVFVPAAAGLLLASAVVNDIAFGRT